MACKVTYANAFSVPELAEGPNDFLFDGTLAAKVIGTMDDPDDPGTFIIEDDEPLLVKVDWEIHGVQPWVDLNEQFEVTLFIESIGPGQELKFNGGVVKQLSVQKTSCGFGQYQRAYTTTITVPANTLKEGPYKLATVVQWESIAGAPKYEVAGMVEEPLINIIHAPGS